jgi:23S rRNA pseudouridine1911/1915/1917 synthase
MAVYGGYSLVLLKLKTGRTHQIRVHMKHLGCPILGDPIYGKHDGLFDSATMMLHAKTLGVRLPGSKDFSVFEAPLPPRFKKVIRKLRETWPRRKP